MSQVKKVRKFVISKESCRIFVIIKESKKICQKKRKLWNTALVKCDPVKYEKKHVWLIKVNLLLEICMIDKSKLLKLKKYIYIALRKSLVK